MIIHGLDANKKEKPGRVDASGGVIIGTAQLSTILATIGGIPYPEFLLDAGASNTLLGLRVMINPLDLIDAGESLLGKTADTRLINVGSNLPFKISCDSNITSVALLAVGTATGTLATTPANTLFAVSPTEATQSNIDTAMRLLQFTPALSSKTLTLSMLPTYTSGRYTTLRVEVSSDQ